jgi:DNA (cytosine-5)-methyltransferase 1
MGEFIVTDLSVTVTGTADRTSRPDRGNRHSREHTLLDSTSPTVIDLFSGAGGTGLGFKEAGFRILGAVELDPNAAETYERNLGVKVKTANIRRLSPRMFREELGLRPRELDVLVGCPPCQGFSRMRNGNGATDIRNILVLKYLRFVADLMPRFAVFENVPGLLRMKHGKEMYEKLCKGLEKVGYKLFRCEADAADFGTAQHRKRVLVVAGRDGETPPAPHTTHGNPQSLEVVSKLIDPWRKVEDVIGGNIYPPIAVGENGEQEGKYPNHIAPFTGEKVLAFISMVPKDGGSRREVPKRFWLKCHASHDGHKDVYGRIAWGRPANTITSGCTNPSKGRFVHPEQDRALTYREAAALQGFPDWFVFHGRRIGEQIGNAVPPPLAFAISVALKDRILATAESGNRVTAAQ